MFTGIVFGVRSGEYITILFSVFVGLFLLDTAANSTRQVKQLIGDRRVGDIMSAASEIAPDTLLSDVVARIENRNAATRYPVTVGKRLHGILTLEQVRDVPPDRWSKTFARQVMRPVDNSLFINHRATIPQASSLIKKSALGFLAVIDNDGFVVGAVTESDLKSTKF
jgi:CBS domain-containing protein